MMPQPTDAYRFDVAHSWNGAALPPAMHTHWTLHVTPAALQIEWDAPYNGDPAPNAPPGSTPKLWEHEVVELMLLGDDERYLELEFGPHGHYLVLQLQGVRGVKSQGSALHLHVRIEGPRWRGSVRVPNDLIPRGWSKLNAFRIAGVGSHRQYAAHKGSDAPIPDFHRLDCFVDLASIRQPSIKTAADSPRKRS